MNIDHIESMLRAVPPDEGEYNLPLPKLDDHASAVISFGRRSDARATSLHRLALFVAIAALVVVGAVGVSAWGVGHSPTPAAAATAAGLSSAEYACAGIPFVPSQAGSGAALPDDPPTRLLTTTAAHYSAIMPASGWILRSVSDRDDLFIAAGTGVRAPYVFVEVRSNESEWSLYAYGDCEPATPPQVQQASFDFGDWSPRNFGPADSVIPIYLQSNYCNERLVGTTVWYTQSSVVVTFWARRELATTGSYAPPCFANLEMELATMSLVEPIGHRDLQTGPAYAAHSVLSSAQP